MTVDRESVKWQALLVRGGISARCDYCRVRLRSSGEMHEIFRRSLTQKGGEARNASFAVELVAILCRTCHEQQKDDRDRDQLIRVNYRIFGYSRVKTSFDRLQAILAPKGLRLPYQLPEPEDEEATLHQPRAPPAASR